MLGFFRSLDGKGWEKFVQGVVALIVTYIVAHVLYVYVNRILAILVFFIGFDVAFSLIDKAMLGSILRNRQGKNKEQYIRNKSYLDKRFKAVFNIDVNSSELDKIHVWYQLTRGEVERIKSLWHLRKSDE